MAGRDSRRIQGPEKCISYTIFQPKVKKSFLRDDGLRVDGRSAVDPRKLFMSVGIISQAKGSSYLEMGNTKVCCGVYGPKDIQRGSDFKMTGQVMCEVKMAPFSCVVRRSPQPDKRQREMSRQLKEALESVIVLALLVEKEATETFFYFHGLAGFGVCQKNPLQFCVYQQAQEKFPKSQIDVFLTVIEDDGGVLSACITAAGLALCHANIDVYDFLIGASVLWHGGIIYADPSRSEEESENSENHSANTEGGCLTIGMMPNYANGQVSLMLQEGQISVNNLCEGLDLAVEMCQRICTLSKKTMEDYVDQALEDQAAVKVE